MSDDNSEFEIGWGDLSAMVMCTAQLQVTGLVQDWNDEQLKTVHSLMHVLSAQMEKLGLTGVRWGATPIDEDAPATQTEVMMAYFGAFNIQLCSQLEGHFGTAHSFVSTPVAETELLADVDADGNVQFLQPPRFIEGPVPDFPKE